MRTKHKRIASPQLKSVALKHGGISHGHERFPIDIYNGPVHFADHWQHLLAFYHLIIKVASIKDGTEAFVFKPEYAPTESERKAVETALELRGRKDEARLDRFGTSAGREFYHPKMRWFRNREGESDFEIVGPDTAQPRLPVTDDRIRHHVKSRLCKEERKRKIFW